MESFLHVYLIPKQDISEALVTKTMNLAIDWYKYSDTNWVVKTTSDIFEWQKRLKPLVDNNKGFLFIVKIDIKKRQGWMPTTFWEWCSGKSVETSKAKKKIKKKE